MPVNLNTNEDLKLLTTHSVVLVGILREQGFSDREIFGADDLLAEQLKRSDGVMYYKQYENLVEKALLLTNNPNFGHLYGKRLNTTGHGEIGLGMMASDTFEGALQLAKKAIRALNPAMEYKLHKRNGRFIIQLKEVVPWNKLTRFMIDTTFSLVSDSVNLLKPQHSNYIQYNLTSTDPEVEKTYKQYYPGIIKLGQKENSVSLPIEFSQSPSPWRNPAVRQQADMILDAKLKILSNGFDSILLPIQTMIKESEGGLPSLNEVASKFHISSRTLNRRLKEYNTSYKEIVTETRKGLAQEYLINESFSVDQISYLLGYRNASNFSKAFRVWMGCSPTEFREQNSARLLKNG